jgi:hypothetical protein
MARVEARRVLGEAAKGNDPAAAKQQARRAATVGELCDAYFEAAKTGRVLTRRKRAKTPNTLDGDRGRIERHIKPVLGRLKVTAVTPSDIERFRDAVSEGPDSGTDQDRQAGAGAGHGGPRDGNACYGSARCHFRLCCPPRATSRQSCSRR